MKTLYADLFPETLLVSAEAGRVFTTSLKVGEHFNRRHQYVMNAIDKLCSDLHSDGQIFGRQIEPLASTLRSQVDFLVLNFQPTEYTNERGKTYPMYELTHDGFALLAMGFTGKEALTWKVKFLAAFRDMERQLLAQQAREANALYQLRPRWQPIVQHPELNRQKLLGLTGHKSAGSITACRRRMRNIGLIR